MGVPQVPKDKALGSFRHAAAPPLHNILHFIALFRAQRNGFDGRRYRNGAAIFLYAFNIGTDGFFINERADTIVHKDNGILRKQLMDLAHTVVDRFLPAFAAGDNRLNLLDPKLFQQFLQILLIRFQAHHHDGIYLTVFLKLFQRINDDGLPVQLQKLFGHRFGIHPLSTSTRKNQRDVHI